MNEPKQPLKKCSAKINILRTSCSTEQQADYMIKIFEKYQSKSSILVELQAESLQVLLEWNMFHRHILIQKSDFVEDRPVAGSKSRKTDILFNKMMKKGRKI